MKAIQVGVERIIIVIDLFIAKCLILRVTILSVIEANPVVGWILKTTTKLNDDTIEPQIVYQKLRYCGYCLFIGFIITIILFIVLPVTSGKYGPCVNRLIANLRIKSDLG